MRTSSFALLVAASILFGCGLAVLPLEGAADDGPLVGRADGCVVRTADGAVLCLGERAAAPRAPAH